MTLTASLPTAERQISGTVAVTPVPIEKLVVDAVKFYCLGLLVTRICETVFANFDVLQTILN